VTDLVFGVNLSTAASHGTDPVAEAIRAEGLGYDFVSANDHPNGTTPTHEVWTLLAWVAARTSRIKVASRVLGVPYRSPAIVAKMAATLQGLSGGRLILGLGGGSSDEGMQALGVGPLTPRAKIDGLEDAVQIMRGVWSQREFSFDGSIYAVDGANFEPKPDTPIPIWLGTFGQRGLAITGRLADGWIPSLGMAPPEQARLMRERIVTAAREAGRDPGTITCIYNVEIRLEENRQPTPDIVSGSPEQVIERLLGFVHLGFDGMNFIPIGPRRDEQLERLAREVLPRLRAASSQDRPRAQMQPVRDRSAQ